MKSLFSVFIFSVAITVAYGYPPFICTLPKDKGSGNQRLLNYYYDQNSDSCIDFVFYGRDGNRNRFFSKKKCMNFCKGNTTAAKQPVTVTVPDATEKFEATSTIPSSGSPEKTCNLPLPPARDWPKNSKTAYAYDSKANQCFYVYYDEETLNANNFPTRDACLAVCGETSPTEQQLSEAVCSLPPPPTKEWPSNSTVGFWYDEKNDRCEPIYYDDETKNANNFNSVENCLKTCSSASAISTTESPQPETSTSTTTIFRPRQDGPLPSLSSETTINPKNEERDRICNLPAPPNRDWISHEYTAYHYDAETEECDLVYYDDETKNDNLFPSLDECLDFCLPPEAAPKPNDSKLTTNKPVNTESTNLPQSSTPKSTSPTSTSSSTASPSTTTTATSTTATTEKPTTTQPKKLSTEQVLKLPECSLQPRNGHCKALMRSYYFNITTMRCQQYIYGGCGATANHYRTETACEQSCIYRKLTYQSPIILTPSKPLRTPNDKYCKIPLFDNKCSQRAHQGYVFEPSTNSCHFTVLQRCSRPLALHKRREDCLSSCAQTPPKIAKVPLFRSN